MTKAKQYLILYPSWRDEPESGEYNITPLDEDTCDGIVDTVNDEFEIKIFEYPSMEKIEIEAPKRVIRLTKAGKLVKEIKA